MAPVISLSNLSLSVGRTQLLDSVSAHCISGQRIALTGPNGCGKSTLLRVLAEDGSEYALMTSGGISRNLIHGDGGILLVQQDDLQWSELLGGDEETMRSLPLPEALDLSLAEGRDEALEDMETWQKLTAASNEYLEWRKAAYDTTPLGLLSPGSALRAFLALALHRVDIDVLLLDEPTNHLDLPSIMWLERSILASKKSVIVVSHDATFLDTVCDHLWVINPDDKSLEVSGSRYSDFQRAKELSRTQQIEAFENQQKRNKRLTNVAEKLRAASVAGNRCTTKDNDKLARGALQNRAGRSGKKAKAVEKLRDSQEKVERVAKQTPLRIDIKPEEVSAGSSIQMSSVVIGYDEDPLPLPPISLNIEFGEHIAIVGFNGVGKSTLLKTLLGSVEPISGEVKIGNQLILGNLMQEHENLPRDKTPRQHFAELGGLKMFDAGAMLIKYGLTLQQVDCSIGSLNPGGRARALLCGFAMKHVNTLVLDEPTNHLDEQAMEEVIGCLKLFEGTVVAVSHNYAFLESMKFTRVLRLDSNGLRELESIDVFVEAIEDAVDRVVEAAFG